MVARTLGTTNPMELQHESDNQINSTTNKDCEDFVSSVPFHLFASFIQTNENPTNMVVVADVIELR